MKCSNCGLENSTDAAICVKCGTTLPTSSHNIPESATKMIPLPKETPESTTPSTGVSSEPYLNAQEHLKSIGLCLHEIESLIQQIITMDLSTPHEHDPPHENTVVVKACQIISQLNKCGFSLFAERMLRLVLDEIQKHENTPGSKHRHHKGMVLHNLAVCRLVHNDFDSAIPTFLEAYAEDRITYEAKPSESLALKVQTRYYVIPVLKYIGEECISLFNEYSPTPINIIHVRNLFDFLDVENQMFFIQIWKSRQRNPVRSNLFTKTRLHDTIKNFCLLFENLIKEIGRRNHDSTILSQFQAIPRPTLARILPIVCQNSSWITIFNSSTDWTHYDSTDLPRAINEKLERLLRGVLDSSSPSDDFVARCVILTCLVRNFTMHEFNLETSLTSTDYKSAFQMIGCALLNSFLDARNMGQI